jgi:hypothetical protein
MPAAPSKRLANQSRIACIARSNGVGSALAYSGFESSSSQPAARLGRVGIDAGLEQAGQDHVGGCSLPAAAPAPRRQRTVRVVARLPRIATLDVPLELEVEALLAHPEVDVDHGDERRLHHGRDGADEQREHERDDRRDDRDREAAPVPVGSMTPPQDGADDRHRLHDDLRRELRMTPTSRSTPNVRQ